MTRREVGSIAAILLWLGLGLWYSVLIQVGNERTADIVAIGIALLWIYICFELSASPGTSVLYKLNRRWTSPELAGISGFIGIVFGILMLLLLIYKLLNPMAGQ